MPQTQNATRRHRQIQILQLIADGMTTHQIARRMDLTFDGAQSAVNRTLARLGAASRIEAAMRAASQGLVTIPGDRIIISIHDLQRLLTLMQAPDAQPQSLAEAFVQRYPALAATGRPGGATLPPQVPSPLRQDATP